MANERLRSAMGTGGYSTPKLAGELGVDPKTVERWITRGVVPHRTTALAAARVLGAQPNWLWPALVETNATATESEVVTFYPHRAQTPKALWLDLLRDAQREITLMAYASLFLPEDNPESIRLLRDKAAAGCRIRIALGDPDSPEVALRGVEEQLFEGLVGRVRMAIAYYRPLLGTPNIEFRLHRTTLYNSIFIYDDEMLVNQHAYGVYGYMAPILHLRRVEGGDLFGTYADSLERVWDAGYPYLPGAAS
ncbi:transcriptional regulator with XRE-family HTH domain [Allocatelliglobosispora scoriae]|uniref:Transcriptional regulator with XRE-family HTH domain n=1 Tax=Allocatelliglobosispora scoriae TaxID=643052 RepID=A0A841BVM4_9ACTN|nr:XRE family transcriptional regulator [Allocatelliglobosispora scoriae]MBB5871209.1 transcriptional regulator with XRE-family HTH domain [Allocatelliglobosispora scoriae]